MFSSIGKAVEAVREFIDPKAKPGVVSDPMIDLSLPARPNLGILIDVEASTLASTGLTQMGPLNPLIGLYMPPVIKLKTVEDGKHAVRRINQEALPGILADLNDQMNLFGEIRYVPEPNSIPREKQ